MNAGIYDNKHNIIIIWGELGLGKSTLALQLLHWHYHDWDTCFKHVKFTFQEMRDAIKQAILQNKRIKAVIWDDLAVYFHRAAIQYMHPEVRSFFSKYNFIRPYLGNLIITVPNIDFIPRPLLDFATADIYVTKRGHADFDRAKLIRSFRSRHKSWTKNYDGDDVEWTELPKEIYKRYEQIRHQHALDSILNPDDMFVMAMPHTPSPSYIYESKEAQSIED